MFLCISVIGVLFVLLYITLFYDVLLFVFDRKKRQLAAEKELLLQQKLTYG